MKDTPDEVERRYREMLMKRSGAERLKMGADMFDAARSLARANLRARAECSDADLKARLFVRFYGQDLPEPMLSRVLERLRRTERRALPLETAAVEAALQRNDPDELLRLAIDLGMDAADVDWAESLCVRLAEHEHTTVRGNAVLAFGHLARRFHRLDEAAIRPIVDRALRDEHEYVRGQANAAADDLEEYLGWHFGRPSR